MRYCPTCNGTALTDGAAEIRGERNTCVCGMTAERRDRALLHGMLADKVIEQLLGYVIQAMGRALTENEFRKWAAL